MLKYLLLKQWTKQSAHTDERSHQDFKAARWTVCLTEHDEELTIIDSNGMNNFNSYEDSYSHND
ncbi:hypothetical protein N7475_008623 [Penicillium sp. IBT 31633x]|nr:hypothetical protein N7475_008623 [Penicillium sp. IBT 31633x]